MPEGRPNYQSATGFVRRSPKTNLWRGGLPRRHRSSIFPATYEALQQCKADILVTHEAAGCHKKGFDAIDRLAKSLGVKWLFHGHQHEDCEYGVYKGMQVRAVGFRGIVDLNGRVVRPAEIDPRDILVMSDEIYSTLVYDGVEAISPASLSEEAKEHTIVVSGFSKAFSMTGWRLGTLCAPDAIAKAVANLQSQTSSNATSFAQYGALAAMENEALADAAVAEMKKSFDRRRLMLLEGLNAIDGVFCRRAQGAFYLFPNISSFGMASVDFCAKLLEEKLVAVVPGSAFGSDENVRFSYAVSDETIQKGIERMAQFCSEIR